MSPLNFTHILTQAVDELSESESYKGLFHQHTDGNPLPSAKVLRDIIELARAIIFPGYFGNSTVNSRTVTYHIGVNVERLFDLLTEQILAGLCFAGDGECNCCTELQREEAALLAAKFISNLPAMRRTLATDVEAEADWYEGNNHNYRGRRHLAGEIMKTLGCTYDENQVGMFLWGKIPASCKDVEELTEKVLHQARVFITPGFIFGSNGARFIRISLCCKDAKLAEALERIKKLS